MNKKVLSEELKRYKQLLEYTFYVPENEKEEEGNLLTDDLYITEQDPAGEATDDPFMTLGGDETAPEADAETAPEEVVAPPETDPLADDAEVEDVDADELEDALEEDDEELIEDNEAVAVEDVAERRGDDHLEAVVLQRPGGMLAARSAAEIVPGDEDRRALVTVIVEDIVGVFAQRRKRRLA